MTNRLDGDLLNQIAERLGTDEPNNASPNVGYYENSLGRIDGDSSPFYTSDETDESRERRECEEENAMVED